MKLCAAIPKVMIVLPELMVEVLAYLGLAAVVIDPLSAKVVNTSNSQLWLMPRLIYYTGTISLEPECKFNTVTAMHKIG
jgi:hypothetical protein